MSITCDTRNTMTLASVGLFLKRFFLGVLTMVILILVNLASLLFLPEILRAVVVTAIWIFIIYCVGHAIVDMEKSRKSDDPQN